MGCKTWARIQSMLDPEYLLEVIQRDGITRQQQAASEAKRNTDRETQAARNLGMTLAQYQEYRAEQQKALLAKIKARREADEAIPAPEWMVKKVVTK